MVRVQVPRMFPDAKSKVFLGIELQAMKNFISFASSSGFVTFLFNLVAHTCVNAHDNESIIDMLDVKISTKS